MTCYAPNTFYSKVQIGFSIALEVAKGFLNASISARRLWRKVRQIRSVGPHLECMAETSSHASGALSQYDATITDHAGFNSISTSLAQGEASKTNFNSHLSTADPWLDDVFQVSQELDNMFEAFNQSHVPPSSHDYKIPGDGSESGGRSSHNDSTALYESVDSPDIFRLFTELF